ncbi:2-amino-4-hydroxy-6-hydroxymethyldihydropteridine diphosphokinase [Thermomicrobium sp.]|uniref:2-amino-4-hydroxy-6- hydroxymethyldihydropteridine diphosphokinase n=1 Tax=Thermomicrobium sp. TaxID=1969469 RepID=UPI00257B468E|nr:2-amino-4-hydroxy-6-hydroxymethyldihydropteridine diphosphokinase [Thermomicrobium sp.]
MVIVAIGLGSNLGDRRKLLRDAVRRLDAVGERLSVSSLYETEPVGFREQPWFLNAVVLLETNSDPLSLMQVLSALERRAGRERSFPNAPRTLDLDLLLYGEDVIETPQLVVPHPRMHDRAFVLVPLAEVAPNLVHPRSGKTIRELLDRLEDWSSGIRRIAGPEWLTEG